METNTDDTAAEINTALSSMTSKVSKLQGLVKNKALSKSAPKASASQTAELKALRASNSKALSKVKELIARLEKLDEARKD